MFGLAETLFKLFGSILAALSRIEQKEDRLMDALQDLRNAVADLASKTQQGLTDLGDAAKAEIDAITGKLAGLGDAVSAQDVETAVTELNQASQTIQTGIATVTQQLVDEALALTGSPSAPATPPTGGSAAQVDPSKL